MNVALNRELPRAVSSKLNIKYRESVWRVQEFDVWSAERICRAAVLVMPGALLVWIGDGAAPRLTEAALGVPVEGGAGASATALLDVGGGAQGMARRLAAALAQPVHVCCGAQFDRFTAPLVERALLTHLKTTIHSVQ